MRASLAPILLVLAALVACGPDAPPSPLDAGGSVGDDTGQPSIADATDVAGPSVGDSSRNGSDVGPSAGDDVSDLGASPDVLDPPETVSDVAPVDTSGGVDVPESEGEGDGDGSAPQEDACVPNECGGCGALAAPVDSWCSDGGVPGVTVCTPDGGVTCEALAVDAGQLPAAWVVGRVVSWNDGTPVSEALVRLVPAGSVFQTGSDGRFAVGTSRSGGALEIEHAEFVTRSIPVPPATEELDLGDVQLLAKDAAITWIGPEGGTAVSSDGSVAVVIPPDAVTEETPVRVTPIPAPEVMPAPLPPGRSNFTYCAVVDPHGTVLSKPANLRFHDWRGFHHDFPPKEVSSPLQHVQPNTWVPVGYADSATALWVHVGWASSVIDTGDDTPWLQVPIEHFSPYDANLASGFGAGNGPGGAPFPSGGSEAPASGGEGDAGPTESIPGPEELAAGDLECEDEAVGGAVNRRTGDLHVWHRMPALDAGWGPLHLTLDYFDQRAVPRLERTYRVTVPTFGDFFLPEDGAELSVALIPGPAWSVSSQLVEGMNRLTLRRLLGPEVPTGFRGASFEVRYAYSGQDFCEQLGFGGQLVGGCSSVASDEPALFVHRFDDRALVRQDTDNPLGAGWSIRGDMGLFVDPETARYVLVSGRRVEPLSTGAPAAHTLRSLAVPFVIDGVAYEELRSVAATAAEVLYVTARRSGSGVWEILRFTPAGDSWTGEQVAGAPGAWWEAPDAGSAVPVQADELVLPDPRDLEVTSAGDWLYLADDHIKRVVRVPVGPDGTAGAVEVVAGTGEGTGWLPGVNGAEVELSELAGLALVESEEGIVVWQLGRVALDDEVPNVVNDFGRVLRIGEDGLVDVVYARPRSYSASCDCVSSVTTGDLHTTNLLADLGGGANSADIVAVGDGTFVISGHNMWGSSVMRLYPYDVLQPVLGSWSSPNVLPPPTAPALATGVYLPKAVDLDDAGRVVVASGAVGSAYVTAFRPQGVAGLALGKQGLPQRIVDMATLAGGRYLVAGAGSGAGLYVVTPVPIPPDEPGEGHSLTVIEEASLGGIGLGTPGGTFEVEWHPALPVTDDHRARGSHEIELATGDVVRFEEGRLVRRALRRGGVIAFERDADGTLQRLGYEGGPGWTFTYDDEGHCSGITDDAGRTTQLDVMPPQAPAYATAFEPRERRPRLSTIVDADGVATAFDYDAAGLVVEKTVSGVGAEFFQRDPGGRVVAVLREGVTERAFDLADAHGSVVLTQAGVAETPNPEQAPTPAGPVRTTKITDAVGSVTEYDYDAWDRWVAARDAVGNQWTASYEDQQATSPAAIVDDEGGVRTFDYDAAARVVKTGYYPFGLGFDPVAELSFERGLYGLVEKVTTLDGVLVQSEYDEAGRLTAVWPGAAAELAPLMLDYDVDGRLAAASTPSGSVTLARDGSGRLSALIDGAEQVWPVTTDAAGTVASVSSPAGVAAAFTRDAMGRVASWSAGGGWSWTVLGYMPRNDCVGCALLGWPLGVRDPLGNEWTLSRDARGAVTAATMPDGTSREWTRDPAGRTTAVTFRDGSSGTLERDALGRVVEIVEPDGAVTAVSYDPAHREGVEEAVLPGGVVVTYERNAMGLVDRVIEADGTSTVYTRDTRGRVVSLADDTGATWAFDYGVGGRLSGVASPTASTSLEWTGGWEALAQQEWSDGEVVHFGYDDPRGLLTSVTHGAVAVELTYDEEGRVVSLTDDETTVTCTFGHEDPRGWLTDRACEPGLIQAATHDGRGALAAYSDELASFALERDANGAVVEISVGWPGGSRSLTIERDANGFPMAVDGGAVWAVERDLRGRATRVELPEGDIVRRVVRDSAGRLAAELRETPEGFRAWSYAWGPGGELLRRSSSECLVLAVEPDEWWAQEPVPVGDEVVPPCGFWDAVADYEYGPGHRLVSATGAGGFTDTRDAVGRLVQRQWDDGGLWTLVWSARGYVQHLDDGWSANVQDYRDSAGELVARLTEGHALRVVRQGPVTSFYRGSTGLAPTAEAPVAPGELPPAAAMELAVRYWDLPVLGRALWYLAEHDAWLWAHTDPNGVPWWVEDLETGTTVLELAPGPFGRLEPAAVGPIGEDLLDVPLPLFPGQWVDPATGLAHNGHRIFDPANAQYLSPDPTGQEGGLNVFQYALGDPISVTDPSGLIWCQGCGAAAHAQQEVQWDAVLLGASMLPLIGDAIDLWDCTGGDALACAALALPVASGRALRTGLEYTGELVGACIIANKRIGKAWEDEVGKGLVDQFPTVEPQISIKSHGPSEKRAVADFAKKDDTGCVTLVECKTGKAKLTGNQKEVYAEIEQFGGYVVGKGKPGIPGGTEVSPHPVPIYRPDDDWTPGGSP